MLSFNKGRFDDSHTHVERAKSHVVNGTYFMGRAMDLQAGFLYVQRRLGEARSAALSAISAHEKFGAMKDIEDCKNLLRLIEKMEEPTTSGGSDLDGEFPDKALLLTHINLPF